MSDALLVLLAANLAAAVAIALVMVLRAPARKLFGPRIAYGLWLVVPLAALGILLPARVMTVTVRAGPPPEASAAPLAGPIATPPGSAAAAFDPLLLVMGLWIAGILASLVWMVWRQAQFGRDMERGLAGPAAIGVLRPRVVTPSDFDDRYTPREQFAVLAHEAMHIVRHDTRINALVAVARCVNWFNPLLHVLVRCLRMDQELACDAQVIARYPAVRRSYAEAMLKTQLATQPLPLGCYWLHTTPHPLAQRIGLLSRRTPDPRVQLLGLTMLTALALTAMGSAWMAKPVRVQFVELPSLSAPATPALERIRAMEPRPIAPLSSRAATPLPPAPRPQVPAGPGAAVAQAMADTRTTPSLGDRDRARWGYERGSEPRSRPHPPPGPPPRRIFTAAGRSVVEPGSAIRLVASTTDAEGRALMTDLTAFGSQHYFRTGTFIASGSRERLFTAVVQQGQRLWVTASLSKRFDPSDTATIEMGPGETRTVTLPDGRAVVVTPTLRAETEAEQAGAGGAFDAVAEDINRTSRDAWRTYRDRCRAERC
jgi:beta-lactamase regulating signal transducer with metallopeptidase domain